MSSGDLHVVPYLDDVLCRIGRVKTRSSRDPEDSETSGEVESLLYEEGTRAELGLGCSSSGTFLVGDVPRGYRMDVIAADQLPMIGMCSEDLMLSMIRCKAWIGPHW